MKYVLDTNVISEIINENQNITDIFDQKYSDGHMLSISNMTYFEIERGLELPYYQKKHSRFHDWLEDIIVYQLDRNAIQQAALIYQHLKKQGTLLEDADTLIAATAINQSAILVTDNTKHFARVPGLQLENWIERS
jgi:tRNA(fMet)-specific endonuclease VapC